MNHGVLRLCAAIVMAMSIFAGGAQSSFAVAWFHTISQNIVPSQAETASTCPATIPFGEVFECSLNAPAEFDTYSFTAATNDIFLFRALRTSGTFSTRIRIFDSNAAPIANCYNDQSPRAAFSCTMTSSGTFAFRVDDYYGTGTGNYSVYAQKLNGVVNAQPATLGQMYNAELATSIEMDAYTFEAQINDQIEFRLLRLSGAFSTRIGIYNQTGERVCYGDGTAKAVIFPCVIKATGSYAVLIDDYYVNSTGSYQWVMQRWGRPGASQAIDFGQMYNGSLDSSIESDAYTFTADLNDQILFRAQRNAGNMSVRMRVYDQDGTRVCYGDGSTRAIIEPCIITAAGVYTLLIDDYYINSTGTYTLHTQRINNPGNARPLAFGQSITDAIDPIAAVDTFTLETAPTDVIGITMTRTSGAFSPRLRVYDTGGVRVCYGDGNTSAQITSCTLAAGGRYTLLVDDYYVNSVGNYSLTLSCAGTRCGPIPQILPRLFVSLVQR
jgi:hypothetical protein